MAYEVFKRTGVRVEAPAISLVPDGRIALNAAACRILSAAKIKSAFLLWDKARRRIAIKAASGSDANAYAVSFTANHSASIRASAFLNHVGWKGSSRESVVATWNEKEKMLEASIPPAPKGEPS